MRVSEGSPVGSLRSIQPGFGVWGVSQFLEARERARRNLGSGCRECLGDQGLQGVPRSVSLLAGAPMALCAA